MSSELMPPPGSMATAQNTRLPSLSHAYPESSDYDKFSPRRNLEIQKIEASARNRWNNHFLQHHGRRVFSENEPLPKLLVLMEILDETEEPIRSAALDFIKSWMIEVSTSRVVSVVFNRTRTVLVPFAAVQIPVPVAIKLITQLNRYAVSSIREEMTVDVNKDGKKVFVSKYLTDEERVRLSFVAWRDPEPGETLQTAERENVPKSVMPGSSRVGGVPIGFGTDIVSPNQVANSSTNSTLQQEDLAGPKGLAIPPKPPTQDTNDPAYATWWNEEYLPYLKVNNPTEYAKYVPGK